MVGAGQAGARGARPRKRGRLEADRPPDIMLPPAARALVRTTPSLAPVPNRAVLSVTGAHAADFLNGIVSSSVAASTPQSPAHFYTAFLHAQASPLFLPLTMLGCSDRAEGQSSA